MTRTQIGHVSVTHRFASAPIASAILVHGYAQNHGAFETRERSLIEHLTSFNVDVHAIDLRGAGHSADAPYPALLSDHVSDVLGVIDHVHERGLPTVMIGHSMGGLVSYFAATHRTLAGVVSIGTPYRFGRGSIRMQTAKVLARAFGSTAIPAIPFRHVGAHLRRFRAVWDHPAVPVPLRVWTPGSTERAVLDEYLGRAFDRATLSIARDIALEERSPNQAALRRAFLGLDQPLLVIGGSGDDLAPVASVRPAYDLSRSSDKTLRVYPLGHVDLLVGREATTTVWPTITNWIQRRARQRSEQ